MSILLHRHGRKLNPTPQPCHWAPQSPLQMSILWQRSITTSSAVALCIYLSRPFACTLINHSSRLMAESKKRTGKRKRSDEWDPEEGKLMNDPHGPGRQPKAETVRCACSHCLSLPCSITCIRTRIIRMGVNTATRLFSHPQATAIGT